MDKEKILAAAERYRADMSAFLRAMISHPGESCEEKEVVACLQEIRDLPNLKKYGEDVKVSMYMYDRPAWTGTVYETEAYFPTWINKGRAAPSLYREEDKIADVS